MSTYAIDELYKLNPKLEHTFENDCITIDNFYENPDAIYDHLMNRDYPLWKYNPERKGRNGIDYNDCRIVDKVAHPTRIYENENQRVLDICRRYFWKGQYDWSRLIEFNCFQTINVFDNILALFANSLNFSNYFSVYIVIHTCRLSFKFSNSYLKLIDFALPSKIVVQCPNEIKT